MDKDCVLTHLKKKGGGGEVGGNYLVFVNRENSCHCCSCHEACFKLAFTTSSYMIWTRIVF